jgi:ubiquinone/menaquinone biosynthesis C-methylase UbiE
MAATPNREHAVPEQAAREWDRYSDQFQPVSDALVQLLPDVKPDVVDRAFVLDLGCGTGEPGLTVRARHPHTRLLGIDAEPTMVDLARAKARRNGIADARFEVMAMENLAIDAATVDVLTSRFSFLSVSDSAPEAARVLRPGGRYAFAVWDRSELNTTIYLFHSVLLRLARGDGLPDPRILDEMCSDDRRARWLREAGMASVETTLFDWKPTFTDIDAVLALASLPFRPAMAALDPSGRVEVEQQATAAFAQFRQPGGSYPIPHTCRLFWGQR